MRLLEIVSTVVLTILIAIPVSCSQEVNLMDSIVYRTKVENVIYEFYVNKSKLRYSAIVHERDSTHIHNFINGLCAERKLKKQEWAMIDSMVRNLSRYKPRNTKTSKPDRRTMTSFINAIDHYHKDKLISSYRYPIYHPNSGINSFKSEMLALLKTSGWSHWEESKMSNNYILESEKIILFEFRYPKQEKGKKKKSIILHRAKQLGTIKDPMVIEEIFSMVSNSKGINPLQENVYFDLCNSTEYYILEFHKAGTHLKTVYLHDNFFRQYFGYWNKIKTKTLLELFE